MGQHGFRLCGGSRCGLNFFKILKNTPLVDLLPVLGHIQFPLAGLFIVEGQLDLVIGGIVNAGRIAEVFRRFHVNQKVGFHGIYVFQCQASNIIIQDI